MKDKTLELWNFGTDEARLTGDHPDFGRESADKRPQPFCSRQRVGVGGDYDFARRGGDSGGERLLLGAAAGDDGALANQFYAVILGCNALYDGGGIVLGTVVNDYDFQLVGGVVLGDNSGQGVFYPLGFIPRGDDDADGGSIPPRLQGGESRKRVTI